MQSRDNFYNSINLEYYIFKIKNACRQIKQIFPIEMSDYF